MPSKLGIKDKNHKDTLSFAFTSITVLLPYKISFETAMSRFPFVLILSLTLTVTFCFPQRKLKALKTEYAEKGYKHFEGDIHGPRHNITGRASMTDSSTYWPGGVVPFIYGKDFDKDDIEVVIKAMERIEEVSCVQFRWAFESDSNWLAIVKVTEGCGSMVGMQNGEQELELGTSCFTHGTIMHELMHALGFEHEQSRPDRDDYIKVHYENIDANSITNFDKMDEANAETYGIPYDYGSIMHYPESAFPTEAGLITIEPLYETDETLGNREDLSKYDIQKLNMRYPCNVK